MALAKKLNLNAGYQLSLTHAEAKNLALFLGTQAGASDHSTFFVFMALADAMGSDGPDAEEYLSAVARLTLINPDTAPAVMIEKTDE